MTLLLSFAALLPRLLLGFCVIHLAWKAADGKSLWIKLFLSAGAGFGVSSLLGFLWIWLGLPLAMYAISESIAAICLAVWMFYKDRASIAFHTPSGKSDRIWALLLAFCVLLFALNLLLLARQFPHGLSDAWINWNVVARFIYLGGADWQGTFLRQLDHPDYPLFLAMTNAVTWSLIREPSTWGAIAFHFVNTFFTAGLLFAFVNRFRDFKQAAWATILFISLPFTVGQGMRQYADMLLAQLLLAAGGLTLLYFQTQETRHALLAGFFIGLAGWAKNEGLAAICGFTFIWFLSLMRDPHADVRERPLRKYDIVRSLYIKHYFAGLAFPLLIILLFKLFLAPSNDLLATQGGPFDRILDFERYAVIVKQAGVTLWNLGGAPIPLIGIIILTALLLGKSDQRLPGLRFVPAMIALQLTAYFGIFLLTPQDLLWHLNTSLDRLYLHVFPLALFWFFLWLKSPEELSSKES